MLKRLAKWWREFKCRNDMHNYTDDDYIDFPTHFYYYTCKHCKRMFKI